MRSGREHWNGWSWLTSDREHCASRVAVEQEEEERRGDEERRGEEERRRGASN